MSPCHYNQQQQSTDLQIDNIQNHSSITSSSSSPYPNTILQTRAGENCASDPSLSSNAYHIKNSHHSTDPNNLSNPYLHLSSLPHSIDVNTNCFTSLNKGQHNQHNFLDSNEQNQSNEQEILRNSTMNYQNPYLLSNDHAMVRRHRSLPAGYFQKGFNHYSNKHIADPMHQRSASFKLPVGIFSFESIKTKNIQLELYLILSILKSFEEFKSENLITIGHLFV